MSVGALSIEAIGLSIVLRCPGTEPEGVMPVYAGIRAATAVQLQRLPDLRHMRMSWASINAVVCVQV